MALAPTKHAMLDYGEDEWGQSPHYLPCLYIREKPFSWIDDTFEVPAKKIGAKRRIRFGDVFFSSRVNPVNAPKLQMVENPSPSKSSSTSSVAKGLAQSATSGVAKQAAGDDLSSRS